MQILLHSLVAALATLVLGFIWYNPKVFGNAWMTAIGKTEAEMREGSNMALMMFLTFLFSFLVALFMHAVVIHQFGLNSLLQDIPNSADGKKMLMLNDQIIDYEHKFRTFKHGAFHGVIAGIFFALPIIGMGAVYEKRSAKYIFITAGYWILSLAVVGGIVCGWE